jgi:sarcosine oxidase
VSPDVEGPPLDLDARSRAHTVDNERRAREIVSLRFPPLADAPLRSSTVCHYGLTLDTQFIAAPHPEHGGMVWLYGGGSGHGFKHGPALAERMARWLSGTDDPEPRFALGPRSPDRSLRTAG